MEPVKATVPHQRSLPKTDRELSLKLGKIAAEAMKKITKRHEIVKTILKSKPAHGPTLSKGLWYANEYYSALKTAAKTSKPCATRLEKMTQSGTFWHQTADRKRFELIHDPLPASITGYKVAEFQLKEGASASEAIIDLVEGKTFGMIECGTACDLCHLYAVIKVVGSEAFDRLYSDPGSLPFKLAPHGSTGRTQDLLKCVVTIGTTRGKREGLQAGDHVVFRNTRDYSLKHAVGGESASFNTLHLGEVDGEQRYSTLGIESTGRTEEGMDGLLAAEFNQTPVGLEIVPESRKEFFKLINRAPIELPDKTAEEIRATPGTGMAPIATRLSAKQVRLLAKGASPLKLWQKADPRLKAGIPRPKNSKPKKPPEHVSEPCASRRQGQGRRRKAGS